MISRVAASVFKLSPAGHCHSGPGVPPSRFRFAAAPQNRADGRAQ